VDSVFNKGKERKSFFDRIIGYFAKPVILSLPEEQTKWFLMNWSYSDSITQSCPMPHTDYIYQWICNGVAII
jgi:hypothetical protein